MNNLCNLFNILRSVLYVKHQIILLTHPRLYKHRKFMAYIHIFIHCLQFVNKASDHIKKIFVVNYPAISPLEPFPRLIENIARKILIYSLLKFKGILVIVYSVNPV